MLRLIKRYSNRKMYDVQEAEYINLAQIFELVRKGEEVSIVDFSEAQPKNITSSILLKALLEHEVEKGTSLDTDTLKTVIKNGDGTLSGFIAMYNTNNS